MNLRYKKRLNLSSGVSILIITGIQLKTSGIESLASSLAIWSGISFGILTNLLLFLEKVEEDYLEFKEEISRLFK